MPKTEYFFVNKNIQKIINHFVLLKRFSKCCVSANERPSLRVSSTFILDGQNIALSRCVLIPIPIAF